MIITMDYVYLSNDNCMRILMFLMNIFFVAPKLAET